MTSSASISGEGAFGTQIRTSTSFYQHPLGGVTPNSINPILFGTFPELEYDSYVTIGLDQQPNALDGEGEVKLAGSDWQAAFESGDDVVLTGEFGGAGSP